MDTQLVVKVFRALGFISHQDLDSLDTKMRSFIEWISIHKSIMDIAELQSDYRRDEMDALNLFSKWQDEFIPHVTSSISKQPSELVEGSLVDELEFTNDPVRRSIKSIPIDGTVEVIKEAGVVEDPVSVGYREDQVFPENILYPHKAPQSHEIVPSSFFGLPIFTIKPGTSLEQIDSVSFDKVISTLNLKFEQPELIGVTLDPVFDGRLFRAILRRLKGLKKEDFEERKNGKIIREVGVLSVCYVKLFKEAGYSDEAIKAADFISRLIVSCKRISQFKMQYRIKKEQEDIVRFDPFFSHLEFNITTRQIEFIGTNILFELFRDDTTLSLNSKIISLADGKIESTLLLYIVSLPRGFAINRVVPITSSVSILTLMSRCYPNLSQLEIMHDRNKVRRVKDAMQGLKDKRIIDFELVGRGKKIVFANIHHHCEMLEREFNLVPSSKSQQTPDNSLAGYLKRYSFPRRADENAHLEFGKKHIPRAFSLIDNSSEAALRESFKGVMKPKILSLGKYAAIVEHSKMSEIINSILILRAGTK